MSVLGATVVVVHSFLIHLIQIQIKFATLSPFDLVLSY